MEENDACAASLTRRSGGSGSAASRLPTRVPGRGVARLAGAVRGSACHRHLQAQIGMPFPGEGATGGVEPVGEGTEVRDDDESGAASAKARPGPQARRALQRDARRSRPADFDSDQVRREYERVRRQHGRATRPRNAVAVLGIVFAASVLGSLLVSPLQDLPAT